MIDVRRVLHRLRRGHDPVWFFYDEVRMCRECDLGTPRPSLRFDFALSP